jgi:hypothetical protein
MQKMRLKQNNSIKYQRPSLYNTTRLRHRFNFSIILHNAGALGQGGKTFMAAKFVRKNMEGT